eukprot:1137442-Pelagomonas_calceolata.AAC.4
MKKVVPDGGFEEGWNALLQCDMLQSGKSPKNIGSVGEARTDAAYVMKFGKIGVPNSANVP